MKAVIFTNQKGGVGKTTLTREIGITLAIWGRSVLLIDTDPQGNLSKGLIDEEGPGLYEAFEGEGIHLVQLRSTLWLLRGDCRLSALEKRYFGEVYCYEKLRELLNDPKVQAFDYVLIDSPPSLGIMTVNGLVAAHYFLIPLRPAYYSLQGTNDLLASVVKVKKSLNPNLELLGVVINDIIPGLLVSRRLCAEIGDSFGEKVFKGMITRTVKVEQAIAKGKGVIDEGAKVAREITELSQEFLVRLGG